MKVMIVDDHEQVRRMIRSFLSDVVDDFVECSDGCDALEVYEHHKPDVVLMDINMPGTDGLSATKAIYSEFPDATVVVLSQMDSPEIRKAAEMVGIFGYFTKGDLVPLRQMLSRRKLKIDF